MKGCMDENGNCRGRDCRGRNADAHLARKDSFWRRRGVNAGGLDGDDKIAAVLQEVLCIDAHNACLVGLCHICTSRTQLSSMPQVKLHEQAAGRP